MIIIIQQRNNPIMEKRIIAKKRNPFFNRQNKMDIIIPNQRQTEIEYVAKDMLFQLSGNDENHQSQKASINDWFATKQKPTPPLSAKPFKQHYQSVYILSANSSKMRTQTSQERNYEESVIPQLKSHLQKLESPQKYHQYQKKKENMAFNYLKIQKNQMKERLTTPANFTRNSNAQRGKKGKKTIYLNHYTEGKTKQRQKHITLFRQIQEKIELIKEARKNRTLRKLLF